MRAGRLLSLLLLLQARGGASARVLAAELEVSERTILRDIDQLSAAGVPVWAARGRDGGFRLREGWSTELTGLTPSESQALLLAGLPGAATELGLGAASTSARIKLLAAVPDTLRADAQRVAQRLHIDPVDWYRSEAAPAFLRDVAEAVWRQRVIAMRYESWNGERERVVKPLGLVLKAGVWYFVALADAREPRTYRLSNVRALGMERRTFAYPKRFMLADWWPRATRRFESELNRGTAVLRVTTRGLRLVRELGAAANDAVERTAISDAQAGWTRVEIPIEGIEHATRQFLGLGIEVEVLAPATLRKSVRDALAELAARYRKGAARG